MLSVEVILVSLYTMVIFAYFQFKIYKLPIVRVAVPLLVIVGAIFYNLMYTTSSLFIYFEGGTVIISYFMLLCGLMRRVFEVAEVKKRRGDALFK